MEDKEISGRRLSFNLDSLERNVNTCNPIALEDAVNVGADLERMGPEDLSKFRVLINRYREDCTCVRIPYPTKERAKKVIGEARGAMEAVREKAAPTLEKVRTGVAPTIEKIRIGVAPTLEKVRIGVAPTLEKVRRGLPSY